jgi:small conductance mechanosensitive channel
MRASMTTLLRAAKFDDQWKSFWHSDFGHWLVTNGLHILLVLIFALVATRVIRAIAGRISGKLAQSETGDAAVQSESVKHRQAVASVISSVTIAVRHGDHRHLRPPRAAGRLARGACGRAWCSPWIWRAAHRPRLAQRILLDHRAAVRLRRPCRAHRQRRRNRAGGVEDVTLRITQVRTGEGEMYTVPNGQIVKALNLSKDWARAVVDVPVPASADINDVNEILRQVAEAATRNDGLPDLLLDEPQVMGVESIELDTVNVRMVARTLPGKQFEVGRRLRALIVSSLRGAGVTSQDGKAPAVTGVASGVGASAQ